MVKKWTKEESSRINENLNLILEESKSKYHNHNDIWRDIDKKVFYLLGFISLFSGYIVINDLFNFFGESVPNLFKILLIIGLGLILIATLYLIQVIVPSEFKTSVNIKNLLGEMRQNRLFNAKHHLIKGYEDMNRDNKKRITNRANKLGVSIILTLIGIFLIILSKSYHLVKFLLEVVT